MDKKGAKHLTDNDRLTIERMLRAGSTKEQIAKAVGKCLRTIYYEIKRGMCKQITSELEYEERYCADYAILKYRENMSAKGTDLKIGHDHALANRLEELIVDLHFSPGAALAEIRNNGEVYDTTLCESTVYNYIFRGDVFLRLSPEHLHDKGLHHFDKGKHKRRTAARAPKGETIEHRPDEVKERQSFGHWEMDSVMGCKGSHKALLVLTERLTRNGIVLLVKDHTAASVVQALNGLERRFGKAFYSIFKSITVDNGCEFQDFEGIEKAQKRRGKRTLVYFCHPYSSYERGSNENMNRLLRRFFPKGTNFDTVLASDVKKAEEWINHYPRKLLGWKSAAMLFEEQLSAA